MSKDTSAIPTLESERLSLRGMTLDDAKDVQHLAGDQRIAATTSLIPHPYPDGAAEEWINTHEPDFRAGRGVVWAIMLRETRELVGAIGLMICAEHDRAELGYWIGVPFWNNGYVTEAAALVLRYGFVERSLRRIHAHHFENNPASGRVMEKLGMTYEGTQRKHHTKWSNALDCLHYGILREEFERMMQSRTEGQETQALECPGFSPQTEN